MKKQYILAVLMSGLFIACNRPSNPDPPEEQNHSAKDSVKATDTAAIDQNATIANDFATKAAIGGMMEVESSANMIKSTENPDVQSLATIMVRDHGAANKELSAIAKKERIQIPTALPKEKVELMKKMDTYKEEEQKNRYYVNLMAKEHQEAIALFTAASANETNSALKKFASEKLPILKHHFMEVQNVQKILKIIAPDKGDMPLKQSKSNKH